jgi:hypothetical protein
MEACFSMIVRQVTWQQQHDFNVIEWPPKDADLSPIELCFGEI